MDALRIVIKKTPSRRGHKKGRKIGQNKKKPCHVRYTTERRWVTNKAKRVLKCNGPAFYKDWMAGTH